MNLRIENYTDKSFVVLGDTLPHSEALAKLGGKYNCNLRIGPAWIFSNIHLDPVKKFIASDFLVYKILDDLNNAFDENCIYNKKSIVDVLEQVKEKYFPQPPKNIRAIPINSLNMEMESEDD